jgi:hypothetical protein
MALAIVGVAIPTAAVVVTALKTRTSHIIASTKTVSTCPVHDTVAEAIREVKRALETRDNDIWEAIDTIREDVKELLKITGGGR